MNTTLGTAISSKPDFIVTPLKYDKHEKGEGGDSYKNELEEEIPTLTLKREGNLGDRMLDNLVDLIVSTRRGSFLSDPDFGFEFWNHEYNSLYYKDIDAPNNNIEQEKCRTSIINSLKDYAPQLKKVHVEYNLDTTKHFISITIQGERNDGVRHNAPYKKVVRFFIEPTAKQI